MKIHILDNADDVARAVAVHVSRAVAIKPDLVLGLATGRTPIETYAEIRRMHAAGEIDRRGLSELFT